MIRSLEPSILSVRTLYKFTPLKYGFFDAFSDHLSIHIRIHLTSARKDADQLAKLLKTSDKHAGAISGGVTMTGVL